MPKLTVEELVRMREKAKTSAFLREGGPFRAKVTVHMGTCGIASGARNIMTALIEELAARDINDVQLATSGCAGMCSHEPMATVEIAGKIPVKYIDLTPEKIKAVFEKHVLAGEPVLEYAVGAGSERTF